MSFPLDPLEIQVQAFLGGVWVDLVDTTVDAPLGAANRLVGEVSITHGRADEDSTFSPGSCTLRLWNDDGYLTPDNPSSPYWDVWKQGCPLRVSVRSKVVFWGEVAELDVEWPEGDLSEGGAPILDEEGEAILDEFGNEILDEVSEPGVSFVNVTAGGLLRRLGQGKKPLRSPIHRLVTAPFNIDDIDDYYPMEDGGQGAFALSGLPNVPASKHLDLVNVKFASDDTLGGSEPLPSISSGQDGYWQGPLRTASGTWHLDHFFHIPSLPTDETQRLVFTLFTTGTVGKYTWEVGFVDGEVTLTEWIYDFTGSLIVDLPLPTTVVAGGDWFRMRISAEQDGSDVNHTISFENVIDGFRTSSTTTATVPGTAGRAKYMRGEVSNAPSGGVSFGHAITHSSRVDIWLNPADIGWVGELAMDRYIRLSNEQGLLAGVTGDPGDTVEMGRQRSLPFLELLNECAEADDGTLAEVRHLLALVMRTRHARYNLTPVMTLDARLNHIANPFRPVSDDQNHHNDVTVRQIDGASARQFDAWAIEQDNGTYDTQYDLSVYDEDWLPDHAGWRLHTGVTRAVRYPQVTIDFGRAPSTVLPRWLNRLVGHRIEIINLPPQHPLFGVHLTIEGWSESWGPYDATVTINCSPARPWNVAVWEETRYTAKGAAFTEDVDATETSITVTSEDDPWDDDATPFDIIAGPERMTVTSVSGGGSSQTLTVVRNVNGYGRAHDTGTTFYAINEAVDIPQPVGPVLAL